MQHIFKIWDKLPRKKYTIFAFFQQTTTCKFKLLNLLNEVLQDYAAGIKIVLGFKTQI